MALIGIAMVAAGVGTTEVLSNVFSGRGLVENLNRVVKKVVAGLNGSAPPPRTPVDRINEHLPKFLRERW